tara:strand:- start:6 stop:398 length:393 start_codon:yes stop_codon:yes gene_type:complete
MRFSQQRETIINIVHSTKIHPTANWIYRKAKKFIPNISLGTVYRNLKQLQQDKLISTFLDGSVARFDSNMEKHDHLKCKICGNLTDLTVDHDFKSKVEKEFNFIADEIEMTIIGTCSKHKLKEKNNGKRK